MLFNIERDEGHRILAYVVPDGYSGTPSIRLISAGAPVLTCEANEHRQALVDAGRHETGRCGFNIGPDLLPDLAQMPDLTIVEDQTGLLVYRRPATGSLHRKILRLETHLFPLWRFDQTFHNRVQYYQKGLEHFGRETITQMFLLNEVESIYLSGRILYKSYSYWIDNSFEMAIMLQEPYAELAERLLVLSLQGDSASRYLGERDAVRLAPAIAYAANMPLTSDRQLTRALMDMPAPVAALLAEPLTRQLTTSNLDEMPVNGAVGSALDVLASCAVVGLRDDPAYFTQAVAAWLGLDPARLIMPPGFPRIAELALRLRESRAVDHLLERDLEIYDAVRDAVTTHIPRAGNMAPNR